MDLALVRNSAPALPSQTSIYVFIGLNTAANHNFLSHDGITNFTELVDAQQNVYGVGYDLAVLLAVLGVGLDGDVVTTKLSLGCDATTRTSLTGTGAEPGLSGHNKFEGDTSLTRNDYFPGRDCEPILLLIDH